MDPQILDLSDYTKVQGLRLVVQREKMSLKCGHTQNFTSLKDIFDVFELYVLLMLVPWHSA